MKLLLLFAFLYVINAKIFPIQSVNLIKEYPELLSPSEFVHLQNVPPFTVYHLSGHTGGNEEKKIYQKGDVLSFRYEIIEILAQTHFSMVFRTKDWKTGEIVVAKLILEPRIAENEAKINTIIERQTNAQEKQYLVLMTSNISHYTQSVIILPNYRLGSVRGLMQHYQKMNRLFPLDYLKLILKSTLRAMKKLQQIGIIHFDIKPDNILLDVNYGIRLCDFGLCAITSSPDFGAKNWRARGTLNYMAPDILLGLKPSTASDMWSLAAMALEIVAQTPIFRPENRDRVVLVAAFVIGRPHFETKYDKIINDNFLDNNLDEMFLYHILDDIQKKYQLQDTENWPFKDFIKRILIWNPRERLTVDEALDHPFLNGV